MEDVSIGSPTIRAGLLADLIVIDVDIFDAEPELLLTARVVRTVVGGRCVHQVTEAR